jgi:amino acid transporter
MKRNVLVFGLIAGLIVSAFMICSTLLCYNNEGFQANEVVGYGGMLVAFSFIFVGIKNYRDKYNNGAISFGKAFKAGLYMTLVASSLYVLVWLAEYYLFIPDFMDKYCTHTINNIKASGATQLELEQKTTQFNNMREMYKSPVWVILFTYMEILPIGLIASLVSALILKRKPKPVHTA